MQEWGNIGSAGIPAALSASEKEGRFWSGAIIASPAVGAGPMLKPRLLTQGNIIFQWDGNGG